MEKIAWLGSLLTFGKYVPKGINLARRSGVLGSIAKKTGTGIFKGRFLPLGSRLEKEFASQLSGTKYNVMEGLYKRPRDVIKNIVHNPKDWFKNEMLKTKYHVTPKGQVKRRSRVNQAGQFVWGGGLAGGVGLGTFDLATGSSPTSAAATTAAWTVAPGAAFTWVLGKTGYDLLKNRNENRSKNNLNKFYKEG